MNNNQLVGKLVSRLPLWRGFIVPAVFAAACLAVSPEAQATCNQNCTGSDTYYGDTAGTQGADSTAIGYFALSTNTSSGIQNTAVGSLALTSNTVGFNNTAVGKTALQSNTTAIDGTAVGVAALQLNTSGNFNTGIGLSALTQNTTGSSNTAVGVSALYYNNGNYNIGMGGGANQNNASGNNNTATGFQAVFTNTAGSSNTAAGYKALYNTTGSSNVAMGDSAGINLTSGSNNIDIGNAGVAAESNTTRIGATQTRAFMAGLVRLTGKPVVWNSISQQLGVSGTSSARFKEAIKPMDKTSQSILALHPVTFRYKKEIDPEKTQQFGLVAEEVEKVNPELVTRDEQGKPDGVRYEAVNAMLLNEFLKEHSMVAAQESTITQLEAKTTRQDKEIAALTASVREQSAQIQKVSAELAISRPTPRVVSTR